MDFSIRHVHLVGIGGTGMSGIAEILLSEGYEVSGSDVQEGAAVRRLREQGARIGIGHTSEALIGADVVVVSSAIDSRNVEVLTAREARIPIISRAEMLAELMRFKKSIAVAGTHGKTTTTSMLATILAHADLDPTYVIGGRFNSVSASAKLGQGEFLVAEADESDASFLQLQPVISIITNIDDDHMATYDNSRRKLEKVFTDFVHRLPFWGVAVVCLEDPGVRRILPELARKCISYGFSEHADCCATNPRQKGFKTFFNLNIRNVPHGEIQLNTIGMHNVLNALAAICVSHLLGIDISVSRQALDNFPGVGRRQERHTASIDGKAITWIDDYAHHPEEVAVTWEAIDQCWQEQQRKILIIQPHRYSRMAHSFDHFVRVLSSIRCTLLLVLDVYAAGEKPIPGAESQSLVQGIRIRGLDNVMHVRGQDELRKILRSNFLEGDVIVSMGAGSISMWMKECMDG